MLVRPNRTFDVLSISALDLFASALGVFILLALFLFPYYLREPSIENELEGARARFVAMSEAVADAHRESTAARAERTSAEARLSRARDAIAGLRHDAAAARLRLAEKEAAAAARVPIPVPEPVPVSDEGKLAISDLDLVFVMDTTGSMDDELADVQANLLGIIRVLHRLSPSLSVGFVAYRDRGDAYLTREFPLSPMSTANLSKLVRFVQTLSAAGGGDPPEPVDEALDAALAMDWRQDAQGLVIVIGDAPAHTRNWLRSFDFATKFARRPAASGLSRRVSAIFTGDSPPEFFVRLARAGGGDFLLHTGRMIESVLLSVLRERPDREPGR